MIRQTHIFDERRNVESKRVQNFLMEVLWRTDYLVDLNLYGQELMWRDDDLNRLYFWNKIGGMRLDRKRKINTK